MEPEDYPDTAETAVRHTDHVAEQQLIGALIKHGDLVPDLLIEVNPEACTHPIAASALAAVNTLFGTGTTTITPHGLRKELITTHRRPDGAVSVWLADTMRVAPLTPDDAHTAATRVQDLYVKRQVDEQLATVAAINADPASRAVDTMGALEAMLTGLRTDGSKTEWVHHGGDILADTLNQISQKAMGNTPNDLIATGSVDLDRVLNGGFAPGRVYIVAGRPGEGKSLSGSDYTRAALRGGHAAIYITLEMPADEVMLRMLSAEGSINSNSLRSGKLNDTEAARLSGLGDKLPWDNVTVIDSPTITVEAVMTMVAQQVARFRQAGIEKVLVVLDYVQLVRDSPSLGRNATRQVMLGHIANSLKVCARVNAVPMVVLAQVKRGERAPTISDLRESGDLEQSADTVILIHSPSSSDPEDRPGESDFTIGKNRAGERGLIVTRTPNFRYSRFDDAATREM